MVNSRAKGNRGEREVIKILSKYFDGPFERRSLGIAGCDIIAPDDFPYACEIKNSKAIKAIHLLTGTAKMLNDWWKQCLQQAKAAGKQPLLIVKTDRYWFCTEMAPEFCHWYQLENWCKHPV